MAYDAAGRLVRIDSSVDEVRARLERAGLTGAGQTFLFHDATEAVLAHLSLRSTADASESPTPIAVSASCREPIAPI